MSEGVKKYGCGVKTYRKVTKTGKISSKSETIWEDFLYFTENNMLLVLGLEARVR